MAAVEVNDIKVEDEFDDIPLHEACFEMLGLSNMNVGRDDDDVFGDEIAEFGFIEVSSKSREGTTKNPEICNIMNL